MKITCQSCQSKYTVSDEKVQGKTVKIKCRKCGATILVNSSGVVSGGVAAEPTPAVAVAPPEATASYTVNVAEGDQRTMTVAEIVAAYQTSVVTADTYVWTDGMGDWTTIGQVEALVAALNAPVFTSAVLVSPAVTAEAEPARVAAAAAAAVPEPVVEQPAPAPVVAAAAVSALPVAEPRVAARRDPGRRGDDLFSPHREEAPMRNGAASAVPAAKPSVSGPKADENSMLFSLSALTAKVADPRTPPPGMQKEDSGIIDLKALADAAPMQQPAAALAPTILPEGGLFGAPVTSAPVTAAADTSDVAPAPKGKNGLIFAVIGLVAVAAIVGVFFAMKGSPDKGPVAATTAGTAETTPSAAAPSTATAPSTAVAVAETAAPSASPSASGTAAAKVATGAKVGGPSRGPSTPPAQAAPATPKPPEDKKPAAKKGKCNCSPGDLQCEMACSTR